MVDQGGTEFTCLASGETSDDGLSGFVWILQKILDKPNLIPLQLHKTLIEKTFRCNNVEWIPFLERCLNRLMIAQFLTITINKKNGSLWSC